MATSRPLATGLDVTVETDRLTLRTDEGPIVAFGARPVDGVIGSWIAFPNGRLHSVARDPRVVGRRLRDEAGRRRLDPNRWMAATVDLIAETYLELDLDTLVDPADLDRVCALLGFPLVRLAAAAGADVPPSVPSWAAPALRAGDIDAAFAAVSDHDMTRGVRRALRDGLLAGAEQRQAICLAPLGLATTVPRRWSPDALATILRGGGWLPPASAPTAEQRADLRRIWSSMPASIGVRLAVEALSNPTGVDRLWSGLRACEMAIANGAQPPTTIDRLHRFAAAEAVAHRVPRTPPEPVPRRAEPAPAVAAAPAPARRDRRRAAPAPPRPADIQLAPAPTAANRLPYPPQVEVLHGYRDGPYRYFLPRQAEQLIVWGEMLQNCLADYVVQARTGQSLIVGQFDGARLVGALELGPRLDVRQYSGRRNARPPADQHASFDRVLIEVGLSGLGPQTRPFA